MKQFKHTVDLTFRNGRLEGNSDHDSEQVRYARRMLACGEEHLFRLRRPWRPLITKRHLDWLMQDRHNVLPILQACVRLVATRPTYQPKEKRMPKPVELPPVLDTTDINQYERDASRLRYARNVLLANLGTPEVVVNNRIYRQEQLGEIARLLRPWYDHTWDQAQRILDERRERFLKRLGCDDEGEEND